MGEILKAVYEQQLDGAVTTLDDAIAAGRDALKVAAGQPANPDPAGPSRGPNP